MDGGGEARLPEQRERQIPRKEGYGPAARFGDTGATLPENHAPVAAAHGRSNGTSLAAPPSIPTIVMAGLVPAIHDLLFYAL
jgi:hypothetical protein